MQIWSAEIKELENLYTSLKGSFPELEKELERLIKADDENMVLLYSRRCLEVMISELCECELKRPRGTDPLKGIIDKLSHEKKVPSNIIVSMEGLNALSTFGTHPKDFDPEQVRPILLNLVTIIKWYLKYKDAQTIVKTNLEELKYESNEPVDARKGISKPKKMVILSLSGLLLVVAIVIVALFVSNIIGSNKEIKETEKSIAVLPFTLLSDEPDKQYLADGMMDAILLHLSKIEDLRLMSRTSTLQYRAPDKTMTEIGRELGVSYLLEGSFQKYGDNVRLIVQLIKTGKEGHVWANEYNRKWNDILSVQSEVAQTIAKELRSVITPDEKDLIEKIPTADLTAYDLYLKANSYKEDYSKTRNLDSYQKAVSLYLASLDIDSEFARAYTGLAFAYWDRYYWESYFKENFMDSCLVLANVALSFDNDLDEAYYLKGIYYYENGQIDNALNNLDLALKINPNYYDVYERKGSILTLVKLDYVKGLENYHKAVSRISGVERPLLLYILGNTYMNVGFYEKASDYYQEALEVDGDSARYFRNLSHIEFYKENWENTLLYTEKVSKIDSIFYINNLNIEWLSYQGKHQDAYRVAKKRIEDQKRTGELALSTSHRIEHAFYNVGKYEEADFYFKQQITYSLKSIELSRDVAITKNAQYELACVYAFLGDKNKAYQYLDEFNTLNFYSPFWIVYFKYDPLLNSIRQEERFQKILKDMEAKYQAEHERVGKWLEEQGM